MNQMLQKSVVVLLKDYNLKQHRRIMVWPIYFYLNYSEYILYTFQVIVIVVIILTVNIIIWVSPEL